MTYASVCRREFAVARVMVGEECERNRREQISVQTSPSQESSS